jgi:DNA-binding MarR family transcriptional regulator
MKPLIINLSKKTQVLSTRERGRELADAVEKGLRSTPGVMLNFRGVQIVTPSYLDEVLTRAAGVLRTEGAGWLAASGLSPEVEDTLELVLAHRKMMLAALDANQIELLGGQTQLKETLAAAHRLKEFTGPELASVLKVKLPNLHQRLKALEEAGAVKKRPDESAKRGKRYVWTTASEDPLLKA